MADYAPTYGRPQSVSLTAGAAITGGQTVKISADNTVVPTSTVNDQVLGVAGHDAASGLPVTVHMGAGVVHETFAAAAITPTFGQIVYPSTTAGALAVTAGTGLPAGVVVKGATVAAGLFRWKALNA